uniref:Uncharacterized protein n=1 Tax=Arion vulgaris TaxID=1028688 RepID=A0A0B6YPF0_9EUPU
MYFVLLLLFSHLCISHMKDILEGKGEGKQARRRQQYKWEGIIKRDKEPFDRIQHHGKGQEALEINCSQHSM